MGLQINHNVAALNTWRNLSSANNKLGSSLEKLSSGFAINKAADNPAGLVISEKLRAQATGLEQAAKNTEDAISVIQVAEGALQEVHSVLNSIRALAVHAANTGANDSDSIAADQSQVDNAIDAITRIANTTKYLGKFLLNGGAGNSSSVMDSSHLSAVTIGTALTTGDLTYNVTTAAARASYSSGVANAWSTAVASSMKVRAATTLTINGVSFGMSLGTTADSITAVVNARSAEIGAYVQTNTSVMNFYSTGYGKRESVRLETSGGGLGASSNNVTATTAIGVDIAGTIGGLTASGNALVLTAYNDSWSGSAITFKEAGNTSTNSSSLGDITASKSALRFNVGANAVSTEIIEFSIRDMRSTNLGSTGNGFLDNTTNGIKTGQGFSLANNAASAVIVIDDAISSVSTERSKLGAYQKNSISTMQNNLGATLENIQSSESRIRDLDFAKEMMAFTKEQILTQAGTSMLAQANSLPQSVLKLIG